MYATAHQNQLQLADPGVDAVALLHSSACIAGDSSCRETGSAWKTDRQAWRSACQGVRHPLHVLPCAYQSQSQLSGNFIEYNISYPAAKKHLCLLHHTAKTAVLSLIDLVIRLSGGFVSGMS